MTEFAIPAPDGQRVLPSPKISFEFFPPKTPEGAAKLHAVRQQLYSAKPEFCSVTYGAGGSTQDGTLQAVTEIMAEGCAAAPHLSCIGQTHDSIRERLQARFHARSTSAQDLLAQIGRDCVGALAILPQGESPDGFDRIEGMPLTDAQVGQALDRVTVNARQADEDDFRISIAGAQEKTALLRFGGSLPADWEAVSQQLEQAGSTP